MPEGEKNNSKKFNVTFMPNNKTIEVDLAKLTYAESGLPGSILDIAMNNSIDIEHVCGGVAACSTCHVIVTKGMASCNQISDEEKIQLENATNRTEQSRLSCQCVPNGSEYLTVQIPTP